MNRGNGRMTLFGDEEDFAAFERVLEEAVERFAGIELLAYCFMPNHWHLIVQPTEDAVLSRFMAWLTLTHTKRWHKFRGTGGEGHLYQGRYRSFMVQRGQAFVKVSRYVERNPLRADLVERAEDWRWVGRGLDTAQGVAAGVRTMYGPCRSLCVPAGPPEELPIARRNRCEIVDPDLPQSWHVSNKCARSLFLLEPEATGEGEQEPEGHRKELLLARLEALVAIFSLEVIAFSVMGNHMHLILRNVPEVGHGWSAEEVVRRWLTLHPLRNRQGLREPEPGEVEALVANEVFVAATRRKLMDLSQFMKELKQHVAVEVNKLEDGTGAFWSGRYKSKPIDDSDGHQLVRSMVYVDLNPLAAGLCETPEEGRHTSLEARLGRDRPAVAEAADGGAEEDPAAGGPRACPPRRGRGSAWLVALAAERESRLHLSASGSSPASARVVLGGMTLKRYLAVVDAVARLLRAGKASMNRRLTPILDRLGLRAEELHAGFVRMATGSPHF